MGAAVLSLSLPPLRAPSLFYYGNSDIQLERLGADIKSLDSAGDFSFQVPVCLSKSLTMLDQRHFSELHLHSIIASQGWMGDSETWEPRC